MKYEITFKNVDKKETETVEGDLALAPNGVAIVNKLKQIVAFYTNPIKVRAISN